jgi:uncharacterized membrane protein
MKDSLLTLLRKPSATRYLLIALLVLAFLGFLDASYLTILHYKNTIPPCTLHGCEVVLTSKFAVFLGLPLGLYGALYYLAVIISAGIFLQSTNEGVTRLGTPFERLQRDHRAKPSERGKESAGPRGFWTSLQAESSVRGQNDRIKLLPSLLLLLTTTGLLVGIYLVYLQAFVLHAFCQYCLTSELIDFLLFDCAWWLWREQRKE